ncbi:hypothetical protein Q1695_004494 [Nippostrongylus brasiliensis]|nr:hypothetical protein Q1695_004494 [Nippostrongylus brasiliensis]
MSKCNAEATDRLHKKRSERGTVTVVANMMHALVALLLIAVNVHGQKEVCRVVAGPTIVPEVTQPPKQPEETSKVPEPTKKPEEAPKPVLSQITENEPNEIYENFHMERYKNLLTWDKGMYKKAREALIEPGKYKNILGLWSITHSMTVPKLSTGQKVKMILRSKFIREVNRLNFRSPMKFGCASKFEDLRVGQNGTIVCLYEQKN